MSEEEFLQYLQELLGRNGQGQGQGQNQGL